MFLQEHFILADMYVQSYTHCRSRPNRANPNVCNEFHEMLLESGLPGKTFLAAMSHRGASKR